LARADQRQNAISDAYIASLVVCGQVGCRASHVVARKLVKRPWIAQRLHGILWCVLAPPDRKECGPGWGTLV
jgi:hypothetical protein